MRVHLEPARIAPQIPLSGIRDQGVGTVDIVAQLEFDNVPHRIWFGLVWCGNACLFILVMLQQLAGDYRRMEGQAVGK